MHTLPEKWRWSRALPHMSPFFFFFVRGLVVSFGALRTPKVDRNLGRSLHPAPSGHRK